MSKLVFLGSFLAAAMLVASTPAINPAADVSDGKKTLLNEEARLTAEIATIDTGIDREKSKMSAVGDIKRLEKIRDGERNKAIQQEEALEKQKDMLLKTGATILELKEKISKLEKNGKVHRTNIAIIEKNIKLLNENVVKINGAILDLNKKLSGPVKPGSNTMALSFEDDSELKKLAVQREAAIKKLYEIRQTLGRK